jgi:hypothetical protein
MMLGRRRWVCLRVRLCRCCAQVRCTHVQLDESKAEPLPDAALLFWVESLLGVEGGRRSDGCAGMGWRRAGWDHPCEIEPTGEQAGALMPSHRVSRISTFHALFLGLPSLRGFFSFLGSLPRCAA